MHFCLKLVSRMKMHVIYYTKHVATKAILISICKIHHFLDTCKTFSQRTDNCFITKLFCSTHLFIQKVTKLLFAKVSIKKAFKVKPITAGGIAKNFFVKRRQLLCFTGIGKNWMKRGCMKEAFLLPVYVLFRWT